MLALDNMNELLTNNDIINHLAAWDEAGLGWSNEVTKNILQPVGDHFGDHFIHDSTYAN